MGRATLRLDCLRLGRVVIVAGRIRGEPSPRSSAVGLVLSRRRGGMAQHRAVTQDARDLKNSHRLHRGTRMGASGGL